MVIDLSSLLFIATFCFQFCLTTIHRKTILGFRVMSPRPGWCTDQQRTKVFWEFESIIMQNLSDILPLFGTPTWPSHHVNENQG